MKFRSPRITSSDSLFRTTLKPAACGDLSYTAKKKLYPEFVAFILSALPIDSLTQFYWFLVSVPLTRTNYASFDRPYADIIYRANSWTVLGFYIHPNQDLHEGFKTNRHVKAKQSDAQRLIGGYMIPKLEMEANINFWLHIAHTITAISMRVKQTC